MKSFDQQAVETIQRLTGIDMPEESSPLYHVSVYSKGDGFSFSASHLSADFQHNEGTLLGEGHANMHRADDWQIHRVIEGDGYIFHYRICKAAEGSGYEAFIVGNVLFTTEDTHEDVKQDRMERLSYLTHKD